MDKIKCDHVNNLRQATLTIKDDSIFEIEFCKLCRKITDLYFTEESNKRIDDIIKEQEITKEVKGEK